MHPVLVRWRGVRIYSYPVLLYLGLVFGVFAAERAAAAQGLDGARVTGALVLLTIPGLLGARLLFVLTHREAFRGDPALLWRRGAGGAAMQGAVPLALVASVPLLPALGLPTGAFWDVAAVYLLVAMVFGRIGCLLHGCCAGRPTTGRLGLSLRDHRGVRVRRIPTQLLEAGLALLLLPAVLVLTPHRPFPGAMFLGALAGYSAARLALQPSRAAQERLGRVNVQLALAAGLAVLALTGLLAGWLRAGAAT